MPIEIPNIKVIRKRIKDDLALTKKNSEVTYLNELFSNSVTGAYLDKWGELYDIKRSEGESDDEYRIRILNKTEE
jgi:hypothetical protein